VYCPFASALWQGYTTCMSKIAPLTSAGAVVVAAGRGTRAGGGIAKQWRLFGGVSVLRRSLLALRADARIGPIIVVIREDERAFFDDAARGLDVFAVEGGAERVDSVKAGLRALSGFDLQAILIHDAARPGLFQPVLDRWFEALETQDGAVPALMIADALKRVRDGVLVEEIDRAGAVGVQTPQAFRAETLRAAYSALQAGAIPLDDTAVMAGFGGSVATVEGDARLLKLTRSEDFAALEALMGLSQNVPRVGFGVDAHRFGPGDCVTLCGVRIPHSGSLAAHSDGDVAWHALADALYGALAEGDIGQHFPPSDPQWKGAASSVFLSHAANRVRERGGKISNVDLTLICEAPRIGPHREAMRAETARVLEIGLGAVAVKATTTEKMGFTGRGEGIAAQAVATIMLPPDPA
jgi:2-C-methyl-D-erythritol 4-phosphate cytidylyltransferase / 2-C-methyl-D-erythritol 2,4-cyclodiphosphate synthase